MKTTDNSRADALTEQQIESVIAKATGAYRTGDSYTFEDVWNCIEAALTLRSVEQHEAAPAGVTCARMGHGVVSIGDCFSPELQEPGIIFMDLPEPREIGIDTGDVFPEGSRAPADRTLAYVSFANGAAIDQTIAVLQRIKAKHFPAAAQPEPPAADERATLSLNPLQLRWIKDNVRDAYDTGYNDARRNSAVSGDSAPGYRGREIEKAKGDELAAALERAARASSPNAADERAAEAREDHECVYENGDGICRECAELAKRPKPFGYARAIDYRITGQEPEDHELCSADAPGAFAIYRASSPNAAGAEDLSERAMLAAGQWATSDTPIKEALAYRDGFIAGASAPAQASEPAVEVVRQYFAGRDHWDFKIFDRTLKHGAKLYAAPPPPAPASAPDEDAYVVKRLSEVLADVYTTLIGDDKTDADDILNAIQRVEKAAQMLRVEVELYRAQASAPVGLTSEQRKSLEHAVWNFDRNRFVEDAKNLRALLEGAKR